MASGKRLAGYQPSFYDTLPQQEQSQQNVYDRYGQMIQTEGGRELPADTSGFSNQTAALYTGAQPQMQAYYDWLAKLQQRADSLYASRPGSQTTYLFGY